MLRKGRQGAVGLFFAFTALPQQSGQRLPISGGHGVAAGLQALHQPVDFGAESRLVEKEKLGPGVSSTAATRETSR